MILLMIICGNGFDPCRTAIIKLVENFHTVFISKNVVANAKTMLRNIIISVWMQQYAIET